MRLADRIESTSSLSMGCEDTQKTPPSTIRPLHSFASRPSTSADSSEQSSDLLAGEIFWLRDFLVQDLPDARIWTYGYNADVIGGLFKANNQNSVSQHGRGLIAKTER
ncbi:hypothetical protein F4804DRAFT_331415 [Jackrogersella minutella]|nr:hypothetical protein F4804DRAFT_331415 [Jackrogersella minutella]